MYSRSQWPRGLRRRSAAARLLGSWVRIPPGAWIFVCCECRVLSGRGLCDELSTRPQESYRLCCVVVCDLETSRMGAPYIYDISHLRVKWQISLKSWIKQQNRQRLWERTRFGSEWLEFLFPGPTSHLVQISTWHLYLKRFCNHSTYANSNTRLFKHSQLCHRSLRFSGTCRCLVPEVSGQKICLIFKGRNVHGLSRNVYHNSSTDMVTPPWRKTFSDPNIF